MKLTRRDAVATLVACGAGASAAAVFEDWPEAPTHDENVSELVDALVATASVVYPPSVSGVEPFVETFAAGRYEARDAHLSGALSTLATMNERATAFHDRRFVNLDREVQADLLAGVGAKTAEPDPDGTTAERVRYYLVNEVLFALFTSPKGGELVGLENPQGHPGGLDSYRGPS